LYIFTNIGHFLIAINFFFDKGPDKVPRRVEVQDLGDGKYKATYLPDDCGRYKVNVKYGGKEVPGSPVSVQSVSTGKADQCKIKEGIQHTLAQGEEYCITVDTENAGRGAVTCRIRSTSGRYFSTLHDWNSIISRR